MLNNLTFNQIFFCTLPTAATAKLTTKPMIDQCDIYDEIHPKFFEGIIAILCLDDV